MPFASLKHLGRRKLQSSPAAVAYLAAVLILCVGGWQILRTRDADLWDAERDTRNLAASLAQHATRSVETVDIILSGAVDQIEAGALRDPERFKGFLVKRARSVAHAHSFAVLDARGVRLVDSLAVEHPPTDSSGREYFAWHRERRSGELHVGGRITGRSSGVVGIPLSRRWNRPDGSFGGVVVAFLSPAYFERFYDTMQIGSEGRISLFSTAGRVLARHPAAEAVEDMDLSRTPLFTDKIPRSAAGTYRTVSPIDGVQRVTAYETLAGHPIVLVAALSVDEILAPWRREALIEMAVLLTAACSLVLLGLTLTRHGQRASAAEAARRRYKNRLREKNGLLDATLGNMDQGLIMVDAAGVVRVCNERAMALLDLPPAMMRAEPTFEEVRRYQLARNDFVRSDADLQQWAAITGLEMAAHNYRRERPNGTVLEIRTVPLPDGGAVRTYTDVTAQRDADEALHASETRYRQLAETTSDVITHLRLPGFERVYVSPSCRALFGFEPEEMLGRRPSASNMHPEDASIVRVQAERLARGEVEHAQATYRAQHKDGHWLWVEASLSLVREAGVGEPTALVCTLRDVTERQRHAEDLREAKQAAEAAAQAKSEFLATMSHEIRTPLNGVIGYADLLADDSRLCDEQRRHVARIQGAGAALLTVVNDILDFSKIEAGELELHARPFAVEALLDNAASIVRSVAERKGLTLTTALDPGLPPFLIGDEDRLRQVLLNLLGNAVKFTERGRVSLAVAMTAATQKAVTLRVWVTDTGIGIPADKRARLFERFSQVDSSVERRFGGTGLGLAISRQLVERMGGAIGVESSEGEGSTFWFTLTLPVAQEALLLATSANAGSDAVTPASQAVPVRILLVDDVAINQELARAVLEALGHTVDVVGDGASAVAAAAAQNYNLVLMDVQMPGMDGLTASRHIRALTHPASSVPIVAMTANVLPEQVAACRAAGMDDHVAKPFRREALQAVVTRWAFQREDASPGLFATALGVVDPSQYESVRDMVGAQKMDEMLGDLAELLRERFDAMSAAGEDESRLAHEAHVVVSSAGMLGFAELSERCAELEAACHQGRGIAVLLGRARTAHERALQEIESLRNVSQ